MTLKGKAKTDYMRDYMRRRRAGQETAKAKQRPMPPPMPKSSADLRKA